MRTNTMDLLCNFFFTKLLKSSVQVVDVTCLCTYIVDVKNQLPKIVIISNVNIQNDTNINS